MINRHIKASESFVIHELEKIALNNGLISSDTVEKLEKLKEPEDEDKEEDDVILLDASEDLVTDVIKLASELRNRGFVKQAETLENKTFILKKAMSEGGCNTLYDFWKETGEAVVNFAHKTDDADVSGYKPKNLNEVRSSILQNLNQGPTAKDKAVKMAKKVEALLRKVGDEAKKQEVQVQKQTPNKDVLNYRGLYNKDYNLESVSNNINTLISLGYMDDSWQIKDVTPFQGDLEKLSFLKPNSAKFIREVSENNFNPDILKIFLNNEDSEINRLVNSTQGLNSLTLVEKFITITIPNSVKSILLNPLVFAYVKGVISDVNSRLTIKEAIKALNLGNLIKIKPIPGLGSKITLNGVINENGKIFSSHLKQFYDLTTFQNNIQSYINQYLRFQSEFSAEIKKVEATRSQGRRVIQILGVLKQLIAEKDPKHADLTTIDNQIKEIQDTVFTLTDTTKSYFETLEEKGLTQEQLKEAYDVYVGTVNKGKGTK